MPKRGVFRATIWVETQMVENLLHELALLKVVGYTQNQIMVVVGMRVIRRWKITLITWRRCSFGILHILRVCNTPRFQKATAILIAGLQNPQNNIIFYYLKFC